LYYGTSKDNTQVFAAVLDAQVEQLGSDPTGQVASGYIKLRAPFVKIEKPEDNALNFNGLSAMYCADEPDDQSAGLYFCIAVTGTTSTIGLVLTPQGDVPNVYRRLGYFQGMWMSEGIDTSEQVWAGTERRDITII
jgi:hypothetical protein